MAFDGDAAGDGAARASDDPRRIRLVRGGALLLEDAGFRLIEPRGLRRSPLHPWATLTHVALVPRALLIGTTQGLFVVKASDFADAEGGPTAAREALLARVAASPGGGETLRGMARLEALATRKRALFVTLSAALLCLAGTGFQLHDPLVDQIGALVPELLRRGELWRGITAHFLHALPDSGFVATLLPGTRGLPFHLAINVAGLLVLAPLVERPLGPWRTLLVLLLSAVGTVAGVFVAGHREVIGASGLVAGLAGAILALELHCPESLPAEWRIPRRLFLLAVGLQFGLIDPLFRSFLAGGAHLGGFAGGYAAAWWIGAPEPGNARDERRLCLAALAGLAASAAGAAGIVPLARLDPAALERHAARLLDVPPEPHLFVHDNAAAWLIATEGEPSAADLELAVALADRAVESTARLHPGVLDTLAEALFQSGDRIGAILTIEEAIGLVPQERYFIEQRRRFTGERDPDDRPPQPGRERTTPFETDPELDFDPDAPRLTI